MLTKDIRKNFGTTCLFNGASTKFLRLANESKSVDLKVKVTCTSYKDTTEYEGSGSPSPEGPHIRLNDVDMVEGVETDYFELFKKDSEEKKNNQIAFKLSCDNYDCMCTLKFTIEEYVEDVLGLGEDVSSPSSPSDSEDFYLVVVSTLKEETDTHQKFNTFPLIDGRFEDATSSYTLMRTNPLLTGNVKITIDSSGQIALNSLDANDILAKDKYKNYKVSYNSSYAADLKKFLDNGEMKTDVFYQVKEQDYSMTKKDLSEQYNDFYEYGASQCLSKYNDEEFQFFAPIRVTKDLPEFFVIFRAKHPMSTKSYKGGTTEDILHDLIGNADIIKTFDLRKGTKIGTYLRNITENANFTNDSLKFSMSKEVPSSWNGIAYDKGQYTKRNEYLYDSLYKEKNIKTFERFVTEGFKRHKLVAQDILNLEFLFDDDISDEYTINRYFGFYVKKIDISKFDYSNEIISWNTAQTPLLRLGIDAEKYSTTKFWQHNDGGIELPVVTKDSELLSYEDLDPRDELVILPTQEEVENTDRCFVVVDRDNDLHRVKSCKEKLSILDGDRIAYKDIRLCDEDIELTKLCGIDNLAMSVHAYFLDEMPAHMSLTFDDVTGFGYCVSPSDKFTIYFENSGDDVDKWVLTANATGLKKGSAWPFPSYDISDSSYKGSFNPYGTGVDCAKAFAECVNNFKSTLFYALQIENRVLIVSKHKDESGNALRIDREFSLESNSGSCLYFGKELPYTSEGTEFEFKTTAQFCGGTSTPLSVAVIKKEDAMTLSSDMYFQTMTKKYAKIQNFGDDDKELLCIPYIGSPRVVDGEIVEFAGYDDYVMIELEGRMPFLTNEMHYISAYKLFMPTMSILSFCPVKDFDSSFTHSQYANIPFLELYGKYGSVNLDKGQSATLDKNEYYTLLSGSGHIDGKWNESTSSYVTLAKGAYIETFTSDSEVFVAESNGTILVKTKYAENEFYTQDLHETFSGFAGLTDIIDDSTEELKAALRSKGDIESMLVGYLSSEYDRLEENAQKKFAYDSKVVPSIVKWVMEGSDVHGNPYRLNMSPAFGTTGFSPSFSLENNSKSFSHEWLMLDRFPDIKDTSFVSSSRSYMFSKIDCLPVDGSEKTLERLMLSEDVDFFSKYFVTGENNSYVGDESLEAKTQERYSYIHWSDNMNSHWTMFRGVKMFFKELDNAGVFNGESKDYEGYKFSAILSTIDSSDSTPAKIVFYDNKKFKTLLLVVKINESALQNGLSYLDLYCADNIIDYSCIDYNTDTEEITLYPQYSDIVLKYGISIKSNKWPIYSITYTNKLSTVYGINYDRFSKLGEYGCDSLGFRANGMPSLVNDKEGKQLLFGEAEYVKSANKLKMKSDYQYSLTNFIGLENESSGLSYGGDVWMLGGGEGGSFVRGMIPFVNLKDILEDGKYSISTNESGYSFNVGFKPFTKVTLTNSLCVDKDAQPEALMTYDVSAYVSNETDANSVIYRYDGLFRPLFTTILDFKTNEEESFCKHYATDFTLGNTCMTYSNKSGVIQNAFINKVADQEILVKDSYGTLLNDLPLLDYVTVKEKDIDIAKSNWDKDYYEKSTSIIKSSSVDGQLNIKEHKSFLGSKMMNVPDSFTMSTYSPDEFTETYEENKYQNSTLTKAASSDALSGKDIMRIVVEGDDRFIRELKESGASYEFEWSRDNVRNSYLSRIDDTKFDKYVTDYLSTNILPLYEIKSVKVYRIQNSTGDEFISTMNESSIIANGFSLYDAFKTNKTVDSLDFSVDITVDTTKTHTYAVVVEIGRI